MLKIVMSSMARQLDCKDFKDLKIWRAGQLDFNDFKEFTSWRTQLLNVNTLILMNSLFLQCAGPTIEIYNFNDFKDLHSQTNGF